MEWLENQFTILGSIPFQNWMPLALALLAVGLVVFVVTWWLDRMKW
jgi:hypothetical protein